MNSSAASFDETSPETFYDIQENTTTNLVYLLIVLTLLYSTFFWALYQILKFSLPSLWFDSGITVFSLGSLIALGIGVVTAFFHFVVAHFRDIRPELIRLGAKQIDEDDQYHTVFENVLDEMRVATGRTDLEAYVLPSRYRTAFSLEDRNRAAVVITEGALGVLDRHEIQAVVAHEVAHVGYGDTSIKSFIHNLVSTVDTINDEGFDDDYSEGVFLSHRRSNVGLAYFAVMVLTHTYEYALRFLQTTISKERERRADATAVEYNRHPQALASALYKLGIHYRQYSLSSMNFRGIKYFRRSDFESLQIVPVHINNPNDGFLDDLFNTHPSIDERIETLLGLAHDSRKNLEASVDDTATDYLDTNVVKTDRGEPVMDESFWVMQDGDKEGPIPFSQLMDENYLDENTRIGYTKDGPMQNMGTLNLFRYLLDRTNQGTMNQNCPACRGPLSTKEYLGVPVDTCTICGGVGVKNSRMIRIACRFRSDEEELPDAMKEFSHSPAYNEDPDEDFETRNDCPKCGGEFEKCFYGDSTSLVLDSCQDCQYLWFEHGEFHTACKLQ
jgi:heat shock protein HtpX